MKLHLTRCISADPNPEGPGMIEEDASRWFEPATIPSKYQPILRGSYAVTSEPLALPPETLALTIDIWLYPTLLCSCNNQFVWSWGDLGLYRDPNGCLVFSFPTTTKDPNERKFMYNDNSRQQGGNYGGDFLLLSS